MKVLTACRMATALACAALMAPSLVLAQNLAVVNGKPVPKSRMAPLIEQVTRNGQPMTPEMETRIKDDLVLREIMAQEAEARGVQARPGYAQQMELARQSIMIRELFNDFQDKNKVTDADVKAEYDKVKAENSGKEYRARHILVEKEADAKALIEQIKKGGDFAELAKAKSKDPGSGKNGGDLDWSNPGSYVPEFSKAMVALKKGELTQVPVKTQFGFHIIKLEDTREANFPPMEQVKPQIEQQLKERKLMAFRDELKKKAKTDYTFAAPAPGQQ